MASLLRSRSQGWPPKGSPPSHKHHRSTSRDQRGSGIWQGLCPPPFCLQVRPLEVLGLSGGREKGHRQMGEGGHHFHVEESGGCLSTEMHYFSPFILLKIYYKKTQLGEGHLSLSVLRAGEGGSRGPEAPTARRGGRHCRLLSPTISRLCCCSWARSTAFSFFSSSICCLRSSLSICSRSASLKVSCMRWLVWRSSRM